MVFSLWMSSGVPLPTFGGPRVASVCGETASRLRIRELRRPPTVLLPATLDVAAVGVGALVVGLSSVEVGDSS